MANKTQWKMCSHGRRASFVSHYAKMNSICNLLVHHRKFKIHTRQQWLLHKFRIARNGNRWNASRQISSINRVVIHVHKSHSVTLYSTTNVVCVRVVSTGCALRWIDVCTVCFDFACALNYSYSPHRFIFGVRIKLHIVRARRNMTDTHFLLQPLITCEPTEKNPHTTRLEHNVCSDYCLTKPKS